MPDCASCRHHLLEQWVEPCDECHGHSAWEEADPAFQVEPPAPAQPVWSDIAVTVDPDLHGIGDLRAAPYCGSAKPSAAGGGSVGYVGFPDARSEPPGVKLDGEKTRWDLVPWPALELVAQALTLGAAKYPEPENWRRVPNARRRYFAAAIRHAVAWLRGERLDPESRLPHLAHLACNALFLLSFDLDDAPPPALEEP